jgi:branched-chain amino acid aminotransferase
MVTSENFQPKNRAFLFGDAVRVSFFLRNGELIMAEECYFFLMASMRKMRLKIFL